MNNLAITYSPEKGLHLNGTYYALFPLVGLVLFTTIGVLVKDRTMVANMVAVVSTLTAIWYIRRLERQATQPVGMLYVVKLWFLSVLVNCVSRELAAFIDFLPESTPIWATMSVGVGVIITQYNQIYKQLHSVFASASRLMWADIASLNTFYVAWIWDAHGRFITGIDSEHSLAIVLWVLYSVVLLAYAPLVWMAKRTEGTLTTAIGGEAIKVAALLSMIADLGLHEERYFPVILIFGVWACVIGLQVSKDSAMRMVYIGPQPDTIAVVIVVSVAWAFLLPTFIAVPSLWFQGSYR